MRVDQHEVKNLPKKKLTDKTVQVSWWVLVAKDLSITPFSQA